MSRTALIVDDSITIRQMVSFTLKQGGFAVLEARGRQDALEVLEKMAPVPLRRLGTDPSRLRLASA